MCPAFVCDKTMIDIVGCLSHPQAREYLMKDVIKELEESIKLCESDTPCDSKRTLEAAGYRYAITLIRDGVIS
jgi:hypothetical protein